jgi:low affinity Fe/Cu permease
MFLAKLFVPLNRYQLILGISAIVLPSLSASLLFHMHCLFGGKFKTTTPLPAPRGVDWGCQLEARLSDIHNTSVLPTVAVASLIQLASFCSSLLVTNLLSPFHLTMPTWWKNFVTSFTPETAPIYAAAPTVKVQFAGEGPVRPPPPSYSPNSEKDVGRYSSTESEKRRSWSISSMKDQPRVNVTVISSPDDVSSAKKPNLFDKITRAAGSSTTFFVMLAILGVWVLLGIIFGPTDTWQIALQNTSSIQVYVTDILLIRQSSNAGRSMMTTLAELQSRNKTCERLLRQLPSCSWMETHKEKPKQLLVNGRPIEEEIESLYMINGRQTWFQKTWSKTCHVVSKSVGSVWAFMFYWYGLFSHQFAVSKDIMIHYPCSTGRKWPQISQFPQAFLNLQTLTRWQDRHCRLDLFGYSRSIQ